MAEIQHVFVEKTSIPRQTTTSTTYVDVTDAVIPSASLIAGKKYLLFITALADVASNARNVMVRTIHGSTAFADSDWSLEPFAGADLSKLNYCWWTIWTAVSGENIQLQFATEFAASAAGIDQVCMTTINLSDDVAENTDWFYDQIDATTSLTTTNSTTNNASLTFAPVTAGEDWLIFTKARYDVITAGIGYRSEMERTGEATSTNPVGNLDGEQDGIDKLIHVLARVFTLGAASNTFTERSRNELANGGSRTCSAVFALNLNKFRNHSFSFDDTTWTDLTDTADFATNVRTISLQPDVTGPVWTNAFMSVDVNGSSFWHKARLQIDDVDQPPDQTTKAYTLMDNWRAYERVPINLQTVDSLSNASSHTMDLDGSIETAATNRGPLSKGLFAVTMELAETGPPPGVDRTFVVNEPVTVQESAPTFVANRFMRINEAVSLAEQFISAATRRLQVDDGTLGLTEQPFRFITDRMMQIDETLTLAEATIFSRAILMVVSEQMQLQEEFRNLSHRSMIISELMSLSETSDFTAERKMLVGELMNLSEAIIMGANRMMIVNETATVHEFLQDIIFRADRKTVIEDGTLPITENLLTIVQPIGQARTFQVNENLNINESDIVFRKDIKMAIEDGNLDLLESLIMIGHRRMIINEDIILTEHLRTMRDIKMLIQESVDISEQTPLLARQIVFIVDEVMNMPEQFISVRGKTFVVNEALDIVENLVTKLEESVGPPPGAFYPIFFFAPQRKRIRLKEQQFQKERQQERRPKPPEPEVFQIPIHVEREWTFAFNVAPQAPTPRQMADLLAFNAGLNNIQTSPAKPFIPPTIRRHRVEREWVFGFDVRQLVERQWVFPFTVYQLVEKAVDFMFDVKAVDWEELEQLKETKSLLLAVDELE